MSNTSRSAHGACKCSRDVHGVLSGHSVIFGPQCFRAPGCCSFCLSRAHHQRVRSRASCSGEDSATQLCKTHGKSLCNEFRSCLRQIDLFVCGWFPFKPKQSNQPSPMFGQGPKRLSISVQISTRHLTGLIWSARANRLKETKTHT